MSSKPYTFGTGNAYYSPAALDLKLQQAKARREKLELTLHQHIRAEKLEGWVREYEFSTERKYRLDFACPRLKLGIEVQGGTWVQGGHSRGKGVERDCDKAYHAMTLGWRVLPVTTDHVTGGEAIRRIVALVTLMEMSA